MKKPLTALASAALALGALVGTGVATPPPAEAAYCGIHWGSHNKGLLIGNGQSANTVQAVRSGRHTCFDRLVVDIRGDINSYWVGYFDGMPENDAYGRPTTLRGSAALAISILNPSLTKAGKRSWVPRNGRELVDVSDYRTFRQVALSGYGSENGYRTHGDENWTALTIGTRAHLPFRTFVVEGPGSGSRLVIDVAHRW